MDEKEKVSKLQIYSYAKVWNIEHSIYSIGNINLPAPVHPYNALYFLGALFFVVFLGKIFPFINLFPTVFKYIFFPYAIMIFLRKKKLDGKGPLKYLISYIKYKVTESGCYFERFKGHADMVQVARINWICSFRKYKYRKC